MARLWHVLMLTYERSNRRAQLRAFRARPELMRSHWACVQTARQIEYHRAVIAEIDTRKLLEGAAQ